MQVHALVVFPAQKQAIDFTKSANCCTLIDFTYE
jgi:hypothetical protein